MIKDFLPIGIKIAIEWMGTLKGCCGTQCVSFKLTKMGITKQIFNEIRKRTHDN